jgi:hypothetical protein
VNGLNTYGSDTGLGMRPAARADSLAPSGARCLSCAFIRGLATLTPGYVSSAPPGPCPQIVSDHRKSWAPGPRKIARGEQSEPRDCGDKMHRALAGAPESSSG